MFRQCQPLSDSFWVLKPYLCHVTQVGLKLNYINAEATGICHLVWLFLSFLSKFITTIIYYLFILYLLCFALNFSVFLKHNRHTNIFLCIGTIGKMPWGWDRSHGRFQLITMKIHWKEESLNQENNWKSSLLKTNCLEKYSPESAHREHWSCSPRGPWYILSWQ